MGSWFFSKRFSDRVISIAPGDPFSGHNAPGVPKIFNVFFLLESIPYPIPLICIEVPRATICVKERDFTDNSTTTIGTQMMAKFFEFNT